MDVSRIKTISSKKMHVHFQIELFNLEAFE